MIELCDKVYIFWDGKSKGTLFAINYANKISKPMEVIEINSR